MASLASRKLLRELPPEQTMKDTLLGLLGNTDQAAAITGAAYLDHALQVLLRAHFCKMTKKEETRMFDGTANGILGTFSAKIRIAYAVRAIARQTYHDLLLINNIRNVFAHTLYDVSFENNLIIADCAKLKTSQPRALMAIQETAKQRYVFTVLSIYVGLRQNVEQHLFASVLKDMDHAEQPVPSI